MTDRQVMVVVRHFLKNKVSKQACHFKKNKWQNLLPMVPFELSIENYNSGRLLFTTMSLTASQDLKTIFDEIYGDVNQRDFLNVA